VSAIRERPVQRYSEVFGFGTEWQGFVVVFFAFSSRLASLLLWCKTADPVFGVLSFSLQIWRYSLAVETSLMSTPSTACQSSACMIARLSAYAYFLETMFGRSEMYMLNRRRARTNPCGTAFLKHCLSLTTMEKHICASSNHRGSMKAGRFLRNCPESRVGSVLNYPKRIFATFSAIENALAGRMLCRPGSKYAHCSQNMRTIHH